MYHSSFAHTTVTPFMHGDVKATYTRKHIYMMLTICRQYVHDYIIMTVQITVYSSIAIVYGRYFCKAFIPIVMLALRFRI